MSSLDPPDFVTPPAISVDELFQDLLLLASLGCPHCDLLLRMITGLSTFLTLSDFLPTACSVTGLFLCVHFESGFLSYSRKWPPGSTLSWPDADRYYCEHCQLSAFIVLGPDLSDLPQSTPLALIHLIWRSN